MKSPLKLLANKAISNHLYGESCEQKITILPP